MEQISAYADGELNDSDKRQVESHLTECQSCSALLDIYREISVSVVKTSAPAPEALRIGVMNRVLHEDIPRVADSKKKQKRYRFALTRFAPVAACLVVGFLLWQNWDSLFGWSQEAVAPAPAMAPAPAPDAAPPPAEAAEPFDVDMERSLMPEEADSQVDDLAAEAPMPDAAPMPTFAPDDRMEEDGDVWLTEHIEAHIKKSYVTIEFFGKLPAFLEEYEPLSFSPWNGWESVYEIPSEDALDLVDELSDRDGFAVTYYDDDSAYAVVMYSRER